MEVPLSILYTLKPQTNTTVLHFVVEYDYLREYKGQIISTFRMHICYAISSQASLQIILLLPISFLMFTSDS